MAKRRRSVGIGVMVEKDWQAEADLDTLMRACEIKRDKKRFAKAQSLAKERLVELGTVAGQEAYEK